MLRLTASRRLGSRFRLIALGIGGFVSIFGLIFETGLNSYLMYAEKVSLLFNSRFIFQSNLKGNSCATYSATATLHP